MTAKGFGYAYTNTRVRVMKSKLIPSEEYSKLLKMSLDQIARYLQETTYKKEIDELGTQYEGADLIEYALNKNLANSFKKVLDFSLKDSRESIKLFLRKYDIWNIKTILRGKQSNESAEEIIQNLVPAGEFSEEFLKKTAKESNSVEDAVEFFKKTEYYETMKKHKNNLTELEDELDLDYFRKRINSSEGKVKDLYILKAKGLDELNEARSKETKIELKKIIESEKKQKNKELKDIKTARIELRQKLSEKGRSMVNKFERSTAPVIGFFFAKENEADNLRIISRGKHSGLPQELIEQQLVF